MTPIIDLMNKNDRKLSLFTLGASVSQSFCAINNLPLPEYKIKRLTSTGRYLGQTRTKRAQILVNLEKTAYPVERPSHMRWSHPGWKTDRTACGVVLHETGHHVEEVLSYRKPFLFDSWRKLWRGTKRVSGYEPNSAEAFAETMRLFIGNPDLLRLAIPARYNYIRGELKLESIQPHENYRAAIGNPNYYAAADRWIGAK